MICEGQDRALTLGDNGAHTARLKGAQLVTERAGVRRQHPAIRGGPAVYFLWEGESRRIESYDPISAAEDSNGHQGGLTVPIDGSIVRVVELGRRSRVATGVLEERSREDFVSSERRRVCLMAHRVSMETPIHSCNRSLCKPPLAATRVSMETTISQSQHVSVETTTRICTVLHETHFDRHNPFPWNSCYCTIVALRNDQSIP